MLSETLLGAPKMLTLIFSNSRVKQWFKIRKGKTKDQISQKYYLATLSSVFFASFLSIPMSIPIYYSGVHV